MLLDGTRIAGRKTVADWRVMKGRLENPTDPKAWEEAFNEFFKARLDSRYFDPIKILGKMEQNEGEGFAIVTLHCSLIEFLAATLEGKTYRLSKKGESIDKKIYYSNSRDMFVRFLKNYPPFKEMFSAKGTAEDFYNSVRCGLVHEARTKGLWKIKVCQSSATLAIDTNAKVVYRNKMQAAFDQFVNWYRTQLPDNAALQEAFIRKFDSLCCE